MFDPSLFHAKVFAAKAVISAYTLICLVIGLFCAYLFARRNYFPLRSLVDLISKSFSRSQGNEINEFQYLEKSLVNILSERKTLTRQIDKHRTSEYRRVLQRVMKGSFGSWHEMMGVQDFGFASMGDIS